MKISSPQPHPAISSNSSKSGFWWYIWVWSYMVDMVDLVDLAGFEVDLVVSGGPGAAG